MKYAKYIVIIIIMVFLLLMGLAVKKPSIQQEPKPTTGHIYASWETMEFDKCVAAWIIVRFIDKDARFVFYPKETEITEGIVFDVPGAAWSRKHRKCTSQCIIESMDSVDPAIEKIVSMAAQVELNFWQLDRWPETQKCFFEIKEILEDSIEPLECLEKTRVYFDRLYSDFKKEVVNNKGI